MSLASAYADATRRGDVEAVVSMHEPDGVVWHNFDDTDIAVAQMVKTLQWLHRRAPDVAWDDVAVLATRTGFVWQAVVHGTGPGGPFRAPTCMVVTLSPAGKVSRVEEYIEPAALAALRG
jgi:ketosteroid isomerase-like protein